MNAILLDAEGHEVEQRTVTPRRARLPRAALDRFAELAGVESPAAQMVASSGSFDTLGDRLGNLGTDPGPAAPDEAPDPVDHDLEFAIVIVELLDGDDALGFQACMDDHDVRFDLNHRAHHDRAGLHGFLVEALLEEFCETFSHWVMGSLRQ